jgi:hypothetical protein
MKSVQERSDLHERERREASERHRRKLEQMSQRRKPLRLDDQPHDSEPGESSDEALPA